MSEGLLILDACVLIDFWETDPSLLSLVRRHVGRVHIAENVLSEVRKADRAAAVDAGLVVVEPSYAIMSAAARRRAGLSFQDHLCLLLARERGWTCVSNDGKLRRACTEEDVRVLWGLELLAQLVEAGGLPVPASIDVAEAIAEQNPYLTATIVQRFVARVRRNL